MKCLILEKHFVRYAPVAVPGRPGFHTVVDLEKTVPFLIGNSSPWIFGIWNGFGCAFDSFDSIKVRTKVTPRRRSHKCEYLWMPRDFLFARSFVVHIIVSKKHGQNYSPLTHSEMSKPFPKCCLHFRRRPIFLKENIANLPTILRV